LEVTLARLKRVLIAAALIGMLGAFAAACDDSAETDSSAQQSDIDALTRRLDDMSAKTQRSEMMFAVLQLGALAVHDMDAGLNETGKIESTYTPNTRTAVRLLALTNWSDAVKAEAADVHDRGVTLLKALEDQDIDAAQPAATALHEALHQFTDKVWRDVVKDLPAGEGGVEQHDEGASTPAADATAGHDMMTTPEATP